eukprot:24848-Prymnesium_polylepis.1
MVDIDPPHSQPKGQPFAEGRHCDSRRCQGSRRTNPTWRHTGPATVSAAVVAASAAERHWQVASEAVATAAAS